MRSCPGGRWKISSASRGFTLLEVVMVIVIVGVLATAGATALGARVAGHALEVAKQEVVTTVRETQQLAVARNAEFRLVFAPGSSTFDIEEYDDGASLWTPYESRELGGGVVVSSTTFPGDSLTFDVLGGPKPSGGTVRILKVIRGTPTTWDLAVEDGTGHASF